ncbi:hypothetical protein [Micromonospora fulviviridis]|uniref:hypothetical protein n=1 Tax=Micromonospora fulviviridis TaxID=47860 RepID=UPI003791DCBB
MGAGVNPQSPASRLPLGVRTAICRVFLRTEVGRTMGGLVGMTLAESRQIEAYEGPAEEYAGVAAEALLVSGKAAPYFTEINNLLAAALPRARTLVIPASAHNGIAAAPPAVVNPIATFFSTTATDRG